jgi:putative phosphoribosyl transferase
VKRAERRAITAVRRGEVEIALPKGHFVRESMCARCGAPGGGDSLVGGEGAMLDIFEHDGFADRAEAGRRLAAELRRFKDERPVVLALPRGGVPVAYEVAKALAAPLDLVLVRKIGAPFQPELAIGAVVDGERPEMVINRDLIEDCRIPDSYLENERARQLAEIERRRRLYLAGRSRVPVRDRTAIVIDDGIATGATMEAALHATRNAGPRRLVLAVPVAPPDTIERLRPEVDEVVCLIMPAFLGAIGSFYRDFRQLDDDEVIQLLEDAAQWVAAPTPDEPESDPARTRP